MPDFAALREVMVEHQIINRGLTDPRLVAAFRAVPREEFVPEKLRSQAYQDCALAIEAGQTISQPFIVALMIDAASIVPEDRVLEVGAGSGYAAAVLSRIADKVVTIERVPALARLAAERLRRLGYNNIKVREGDGSLGCPEEAPFDAILCAAAGPTVPEPLLAQVAPDGCIVMPVKATSWYQMLIRVTLDPSGRPHLEELDRVRFVPMVGAFAYAEQ